MAVNQHTRALTLPKMVFDVAKNSICFMPSLLKIPQPSQVEEAMPTGKRLVQDHMAQ
jgi:hypothetical protein